VFQLALLLKNTPIDNNTSSRNIKDKLCSDQKKLKAGDRNRNAYPFIMSKIFRGNHTRIGSAFSMYYRT
jgi:hypothetical protein